MWVEEFEMIELSEIMCQWGDAAFFEMLFRVSASCTHENIRYANVMGDDRRYAHAAISHWCLTCVQTEHKMLTLETYGC